MYEDQLYNEQSEYMRSTASSTLLYLNSVLRSQKPVTGAPVREFNIITCATNHIELTRALRAYSQRATLPFGNMSSEYNFRILESAGRASREWWTGKEIWPVAKVSAFTIIQYPLVQSYL